MDIPQFIYLVLYSWTFGMCIRVWYNHLEKKKTAEYTGLNKIEIYFSFMGQLRDTW